MRHFAFIAALLLAVPARAASEGGDNTEFYLTALNLLILLGVLFYVGRKPIRTLQYRTPRRLCST